MNAFGTVLKAHRAARNFSQHRLSHAAQTTQRHVSFLETGRSRPTREMVARLCEALALPPGGRAELYRAGGFVSPYTDHDMNDAEIQKALSIIDRFVLGAWPYPAFVLTQAWRIVRANRSAAALLGTTPQTISKDTLSFVDVILSEDFRTRIANWHEVSTVFYARLAKQAAWDKEAAHELARLKSAGALTQPEPTGTPVEQKPTILATRMRAQNGAELAFTSVVGHFASTFDQLMSGLEVEFLFPIDQDTATWFQALG